MNPLDPLQALGLLDKLVVEHGAAAIQKVHIELLREVIKTMDAEAKRLRDRVIELESEVRIVRDTNQQLHLANHKLKTDLQSDDAPGEMTIEPVELQMLQLLAQGEATFVRVSVLPKVLKISKAKSDYHIARLAEAGLVHHNVFHPFEGDVVRIVQPGREFLVNEGLIK